MAKPFPFRLILASGSRGRRELLERTGWPFQVQVSHVDEPTEARLGDVRHYVAELAWLKAQAVTKTLVGTADSDAVVIAADTVGWHAGHVVGKPDDRDHARQIIASLAGTTHELWTGVCLSVVRDGYQISWQECSHVTMQPMSDAAIEAYLDTRLWEGCSGAYALQMPNDPLMSVQGSLSNVIGLPMESLTVRLMALAAGWQHEPS